jgi:hypothetical protein
MIKYHARGITWGDPIEPVEVKSETPKFVTLASGQRWAKTSQWDAYFDTWEEAYNFLHARASRAVTNANAVLEETVRRLKAIEALQKP